MEQLTSFLNSKIIHSSDYNFVSMKRGKFKITGENLNTYLKLHLKAVPEFTKSNSPSLVWRKPDTKHIPLTFDFDFLHVDKIEFSKAHIEELSRIICQSLVTFDNTIEQFAICITRKENPYVKIKDGKSYWKQGVHVYIVGLLIEIKTSNLLYSHLKEQLYPFCKTHGFCQKYETLDRDVSPWGKNGVLMCGDYKPLCDERYYICYTAAYNLKIIKQDHYPVCDWHNTLKKYYKHMYAFLVHPKRTVEWKIIDHDIPESAELIQQNTDSHHFDLQLFLEKTKSHFPDFSEYSQIIIYLCSIKHPRNEVVSLCNQYWKDSPKFDPTETPKFYDSNINTTYSTEDERYVTRGTIKRYVSLYKTDLYFQANSLWDSSIVQMSTFYNDYTVFTNKQPFEKYEVHQFIMDSICYISENQIFAYKMYVERKDKHKNIIRFTNTHLTKKAPFTQSDDFQVLLFPDRDLLIKKLKSYAKQNVNQLEKCTDLIKNTKLCLTEFRRKCKNLLGSDFPDPVLTKMSSMVYAVQLLADIPRFNSIVFEPYCGTSNDTLTLDSYNTYQPNFYESYNPKRTVEIKDTVIYKFLFEVYNHANSDKLQLNYILDFLSWKLKHPNRRSERLWQICSQSQGSGKSSFYRLIVLIFSKDLCAFHVTLDTLICRFNDDNHSKLFHWCDDVQSATRAQTRSLFPLVTSSSIKYEQKGEKRIEMNEFSEIILTSNDTSPTYTSYQDRRQVVLGISSCWKDKPQLERRQLFDSLYSEFIDFDIGFAWYSFLKQRDISNWHPSMNPPLDFTSQSKIDCMPPYHRFCAEFFVESEWFNYRGCGLYNCENILVERENVQTKFIYYIGKKTLIDMF